MKTYETAVRNASKAFLAALKSSVPDHDDIPAPLVCKPHASGGKPA